MSAAPFPSSGHDWDLRSSPRDGSMSRYRDQYDVDIDIRSAGGSMIEVHVRNLATGRRTVKMFDVYNVCNLGPFGVHGLLAEMSSTGQPSAENESVSRKLLKLFL